MQYHLLLVDDDASLLALLALHFEELGWEVRLARTCKEALPHAAPPLHMALLDYQLPDGAESARSSAAACFRPPPRSSRPRTGS